MGGPEAMRVQGTPIVWRRPANPVASRHPAKHELVGLLTGRMLVGCADEGDASVAIDGLRTSAYPTSY